MRRQQARKAARRTTGGPSPSGRDGCRQAIMANDQLLPKAILGSDAHAGAKDCASHSVYSGDPALHFDLPKSPNCVSTMTGVITQPRRASMRKLLFAITMILGVGLFVGSTITPSPAQPI